MIDGESSFGTDMRRTLELAWLSRKLEIGPTGKGVTKGPVTRKTADSSKVERDLTYNK